MIEMYKIATGKYDEDVSSFIKYKSNALRGHQYKLEKTRCRLDTRKYSFVHRCTDNWNNLPEHVVTAPSVQSFEKQLDKAWANVPIKFDIDSYCHTIDKKILITDTNFCMRTRNDVSDLDLTLEADEAYWSEKDLWVQMWNLYYVVALSLHGWK